MRVLITGAAGFVGTHLIRELCTAGHEPIGLDIRGARQPLCSLLEADLTSRQEVVQAIRDAQPEACVHLAGIAFVPAASSDPARVLSVNSLGTLALLEGFRQLRPVTKLLIISSAEIYGTPANPSTPLTEQASLKPENLYAISKAAADLTGLLYARDHGMPVMTARPFNHIGPGQSRSFVIPAIASQLAAMKVGKTPRRLQVGNQDSARDFMDVRDTVRGYRLILEKGVPGEAYNLATGRLHRIGDVLKMLCDIAEVSPVVETVEALYRPTSASPLLDTTKIRRQTGWVPEIPIETSLRDVFEEQLAPLESPTAK